MSDEIATLRPSPPVRLDLARLPPPGWTTRFAPAPTGLLHLGHAVNAVYVWGVARAAGGRVLLRVEDHDRSRSRPAFERALLDDLDWLGLEPDLGPTGAYRAGPCELRQSERGEIYSRELAKLAQSGLVYVCNCSRSTIEAAAPPLAGHEAHYPGTCRTRALPEGSSPMRRVRLEREELVFDDLRLGVQRQTPAEQCGDLLARDRHGQWTYQFAVVVDDLLQGIDLVIRGEDLLASTGRQIQLGQLLGRTTPPRFLHHPLVRKPNASKLSKSSGDTGLAELRAAGWSPERVLGTAAWLGGLQPEPRDLSAVDLPGPFA